MRLRQRLARLRSNWKTLAPGRNSLPFASKNNGFDGTDSGAGVQQAGAGETHRHARGDERRATGYVGRKDESTEKFYNGDCAMTTASSGSLANIREYAKFNYGVGMMPYDADAKDAPQNAIIRRSQPVGDAG
ncbi:hypothetical protein ACVXHB_25485 [Escherichia coli]